MVILFKFWGATILVSVEASSFYSLLSGVWSSHLLLTSMCYRQLSYQVGSDVGSFDLHSDEAEYPFVLMAVCVILGIKSSKPALQICANKNMDDTDILQFIKRPQRTSSLNCSLWEQPHDELTIREMQPCYILCPHKPAHHYSVCQCNRDLKKIPKTKYYIEKSILG